MGIILNDVTIKFYKKIYLLYEETFDIPNKLDANIQHEYRTNPDIFRSGVLRISGYLEFNRGKAFYKITDKFTKHIIEKYKE